MAKSKKANLNAKDMQKKAVKLLKAQTNWQEVNIRLVEHKQLPTGQYAFKFTGYNPKEVQTPPISIYLDRAGKEITVEDASSTGTIEISNQDQLLKTLQKNKDNAEKRCEDFTKELNAYLKNLHAQKHNKLESCLKEKDCGCGGHSHGAGGLQKVDLVILIDTSGSMSVVGQTISTAAETALKDIDCPTDLRLTWLGIGATFPGTEFKQTSRDYLLSFGTCTSLTTPDPGASSSNPEREEGARTIIDLCNCFDWREDACRSIFYISDEPIHRGTPYDAADDTETLNAIAAAKANDVTVFAHYIKNASPTPTGDEQNYIDICQESGGKEFIDADTSETQYVNLLNLAICKACGSCKTADWSEIKPCISIAWGDSDCDCMETDDLEVLSISVCNCYDNVRFENFTIGYLYVVDKDGNKVPNLPDGTPSVEILPLGPICFGTIEPCVDDQPTCVSRQIVLRTRGAKSGKYKLMMGNICYKAAYAFSEENCFEFELCKD